jgi:hypothetical protein
MKKLNSWLTTAIKKEICTSRPLSWKRRFPLKIKSIRYTKKSRKSPESPKAIRKGSIKKFGQFVKNWGKTIKVV